MTLFSQRLVSCVLLIKYPLVYEFVENNKMYDSSPELVSFT